MFRFAILLVISLFGSSCNKILEVSCPNSDENEGLIVQSYAGEDFDCIAQSFTQDGLRKGVIIQSETELRALFAMVDLPEQPCDLTSIDLNEYTLLGIQTQGSGCSISYRRSVTHSLQVFTFEVTLRECGGCEPLHLINHWVTVKKLPTGTQVQFRVRKQIFNE